MITKFLRHLFVVNSEVIPSTKRETKKPYRPRKGEYCWYEYTPGAWVRCVILAVEKDTATICGLGDIGVVPISKTFEDAEFPPGPFHTFMT